MKKCYSLLRWPRYYRCSIRLLFKQTGSSSTKGNHHLSFSFLELGRRKRSMQLRKFVAAQKMLLKQEIQQTFVNGLLGFITLGIYTPLEARVLLNNNCMSCPSIWAITRTAH